MSFRLPPIALGVSAPLIGNLADAWGWGAPATLVVTALAASVGVSAGLLLMDHMFPDGRSGWGRVGAFWLGVAILLPAVGLGGLMGGSAAAAFLGAVIWVAASFLLLADVHLLSASQAWRFAAILHVGVLSVALVGAAFQSLAPYLFAVTVPFGGYLANRIVRHVQRMEPAR